MQYFRASFLVLSAALCGCVSIPAKPAPERLSVDVTSLSASGASLVNPHSFAYALPTGEEPLVDQRLAEEFGNRMGARLHTRKDKSPDWLVQVSHSVTPTDDLIPEKNYKKREFYQSRLILFSKHKLKKNYHLNYK